MKGEGVMQVAQSPVEALRIARALLVERGWTRKVWRDEKGCLCLLGAVRIAVYGSVDDFDSANWDLFDDVRHELSLTCYELHHDAGVIGWNDRQQSVEPVLVLFDAAIARLGRSEQ